MTVRNVQFIKIIVRKIAMPKYKYIALIVSLCSFVTSSFASVPNEITLGNIAYYKIDQNDFGNEKSAQFVPKGETLSNWTSKVAIYSFMNEKDPVQFAKQKSGASSQIEFIDDDKNNILQFFNTMNPVGDVGDPITFQQNVWRYQKLNFDKGINAVEYSARSMLPNQSAPQATSGISQQIQMDIKSLPLESYAF